MILKRKTAPLVPPERVARVHDEDRAAFGREHHFNADACSILIPRDVVGKPPIARQAVGGRTLESLEICVVQRTVDLNPATPCEARIVFVGEGNLNHAEKIGAAVHSGKVIGMDGAAAVALERIQHPDLVRKLHLNVAAELVDFSHQASPSGPSSDKRDGFWSL